MTEHPTCSLKGRLCRKAGPVPLPDCGRVEQGRGAQLQTWTFQTPLVKELSLIHNEKLHNPKAPRTHVLRFLAPKTISYRAFGLF